jgi:SAM-dependent methyltransferase
MDPMPEHLELRQSWDAAHQSKPLPEGPEAGVLAFLEHVKPQLSPRAPLLDAGCGRGRNALALSRLGFTVYACDLSPVALAIAKGRAQDIALPIRFQVSDLTCLPYAKHTFSATICVHVLPYHFKADIVKGMREFWRVLQPNGWLYLDLLDPEDAEYGCGEKLEENTFLDSGGTPLHFSPRAEIDELTQGFAVERVTRIEFRPSPGRTRVAWSVWAVKSSLE